MNYDCNFIERDKWYKKYKYDIALMLHLTLKIKKN